MDLNCKVFWLDNDENKTDSKKSRFAERMSWDIRLKGYFYKSIYVFSKIPFPAIYT